MRKPKSCSESRMRSRTSRGVPEWSGGKYLYMGSPVLVTGKVSGVIGIAPGPPEGSRGSTGWGYLSRRAPWAEVGGEPAPGGLVCPFPLAHKAPQHLPGPPKPLSDTLVITRYPGNNSGLQYPSSNISFFTSGPFRSSSSRPGSHPGLRTTFGNHILFPITTLASPNLKCVDPTGSGTMQT